MSSREQQQQQPRARKERFIVIPFCRSASSVDVVQTNKPAQGVGGEVASAAPAERKPAAAKTTESLSLVARLLRGFKNLSHQIFAVHDEEEDEDDEEEQEMVIGLPTDVKHVAHIGWDGSTSTTNSLRSWNRAAPPPPDAASASTSSSSAAAPPPEQALSERQFELAMAAQASAAAGTNATATTASGSGPSSSTAQRRHRHYS